MVRGLLDDADEVAVQRLDSDEVGATQPCSDPVVVALDRWGAGQREAQRRPPPGGGPGERAEVIDGGIDASRLRPVRHGGSRRPALMGCGPRIAPWRSSASRSARIAWVDGRASVTCGSPCRWCWGSWRLAVHGTAPRRLPVPRARGREGRAGVRGCGRGPARPPGVQAGVKLLLDANLSPSVGRVRRRPRGGVITEGPILLVRMSYGDTLTV